MFAWLYKWRGIEKPFGKIQVTRAQIIKVPEADDKNRRDKVKFTKTEYQLRLSFVIYADFESVLRKQDSYEPSSSKSFTTQYKHHVPCGSYIYVKCGDGRYFERAQVNIGDDAAEKFLGQALAAATICRQHLTNKFLWNGLPKNNGGSTTTPQTARSVPNHSSQQIKKSSITIIWWVNIEIKLTTNATWITISIQRKWKFYALFTTSKVYCFYVIAIFTIASFMIDIFMILILIAIFYLHHILQIKIVSAFF